MGRQQEFAFDEQDHQRMMRWLDARGAFLCLPRIAERDATPTSLTEASAKSLVVFDESVADLIVAAGRPKGAEHVVYVGPRGLVLELSRTQPSLSDPDAFEVSGSSRVFYQTGRVPTEQGERMKKEFAALVRWIKKSSPWIVGGRPPVVCVGPSLGRRIQEGETYLVHGNGTPFKKGLSPNPRHRPVSHED